MAAGWIRHVAKCLFGNNGIKKRGDMKPYRTLATVRLFAGVVGLTDDQVKWRAGCLSKIEDNVYEIKKGVVFKAGEIIGLEDAPKPFAKILECLEPKPTPILEPIPEPVKKPVVVRKKASSKRKA